MGVNFDIKYYENVVKKDIPRLSKEWRLRIQKSIEDKLSTLPQIYGKPLRQSLGGYRKLRVGDYRVIFKIKKRIVKILIIQHRSVVYKLLNKRMPK